MSQTTLNYYRFYKTNTINHHNTYKHNTCKTPKKRAPNTQQTNNISLKKQHRIGHFTKKTKHQPHKKRPPKYSTNQTTTQNASILQNQPTPNQPRFCTFVSHETRGFWQNCFTWNGHFLKWTNIFLIFKIKIAHF